MGHLIFLFVLTCWKIVIDAIVPLRVVLVAIAICSELFIVTSVSVCISWAVVTILISGRHTFSGRRFSNRGNYAWFFGRSESLRRLLLYGLLSRGRPWKMDWTVVREHRFYRWCYLFLCWWCSTTHRSCKSALRRSKSICRASTARKTVLFNRWLCLLLDLEWDRLCYFWFWIFRWWLFLIGMGHAFGTSVIEWSIWVSDYSRFVGSLSWLTRRLSGHVMFHFSLHVVLIQLFYFAAAARKWFVNSYLSLVNSIVVIITCPFISFVVIVSGLLCCVRS